MKTLIPLLALIKVFLKRHIPFVVRMFRAVLAVVKSAFIHSQSHIFYFSPAQLQPDLHEDDRFVLKEIVASAEFCALSNGNQFWESLDQEMIRRRFEEKQTCIVYLEENLIVCLGWLVTAQKPPFSPRFPKAIDLAKTPYFCGAMIHRDYIVKRDIMTAFYRKGTSILLKKGCPYVIACVHSHNKYGLQIIRRAGFVDCGYYRWIKIFGIQREHFTFTKKLGA